MLSLAIAFPAGVNALQARAQAAERLALLSQTVADADAAGALLPQAEAAAMAFPDESYDGPAQQALLEARLDATLMRLQEATHGDPLLRSHAGALGVLVRMRLEGLSSAMQSPRSDTGRAQAQAARIVADQITAAARQRAAVEETIAGLATARLDLVFAGSGLAVLLVLGAGMLWRAPLTAGARRMRLAASALDVWPEDVPIGLGLLDRDLVVVSANGCLGRLLGAPTPGSAALVGRPLAGAAPAAMASLGPELRRLLAGGAEGAGQEVELSATANAEARICLVAIRPIGGGLQAPAGLSLMVMDVTERVQAQGSNAALARELNHRVKNTFATVQSLAAQTLRGSAGDLQRFSSAFTGRLMALARSHDLLLARGFGAIALSDVAQSALEPFRGSGQIAIAGVADVAVRPPQAQALIMALHELAGNAARHGALSRPEGRVTLRWDHGSEPGEVCLLWQERGGPRLEAPPSRRGFGLRLLERGVAHDLGIAARVTLRFDHQGLSCEISFAPTRLELRAAAA
ncbi:sensor histidine kinase [Humitalea rosea]|uniref:sensor histidine kinase n=1 Tax=Humitalea rosea TaxID=990373 RepID=UPI00131421DF|nr:PAS domain-containing sensor histidine kinase [Humitalea rosea]